MERRTLGNNGPSVSSIGLGCMGMSEFYGRGDDAESVATIHRFIEAGGDLIDTADIYGPFTNEELIGRAIKGRRDRVVLATKFGIVRDPKDNSFVGVNGHPDYVRQACDASLSRLGVDHIDLYYLHRLDPNVPVEDTVGAMAGLVRAGKVRHIGLSEVDAATVRRAVAVHPVAAVQSEYSLWNRDPEDDVLPALKELGVGFVPYSPLGRGFLTGQIRRFEDFEPNDYRRSSPRFQGENFTKNLRLVDKIGALAEAKGCTPAQLALAWVLAQGGSVVPIPGTKRRDRLDENLAAGQVRLTPDDLAGIEAVSPKGVAAGERHAGAEQFRSVNPPQPITAGANS